MKTSHQLNMQPLMFAVIVPNWNMSHTRQVPKMSLHCIEYLNTVITASHLTGCNRNHFQNFNCTYFMIMKNVLSIRECDKEQEEKYPIVIKTLIQTADTILMAQCKTKRIHHSKVVEGNDCCWKRLGKHFSNHTHCHQPLWSDRFYASHNLHTQ